MTKYYEVFEDRIISQIQWDDKYHKVDTQEWKAIVRDIARNNYLTFKEEKELINLPSYMLDECKAIISDQDDVAAINAGKVGIVFEEFEDKTFHKKCIGVRWVDLD